MYMRIWSITFVAILLLCGYGAELAGQGCEPCRSTVRLDRICTSASCLEHMELQLTSDPHDVLDHTHHYECRECYLEADDSQLLSILSQPLKIAVPEPLMLEPVVLSWHYRPASTVLTDFSPRIHLLNLSLRSVVLRS